MPTFRRLLSFLGPYRRQNIASIVLASLAMGMTVLIPWLVGRAVNAVDDGDTDGLVPLVIAIVVAGLLRLGLTASRRVVAGKVSLAVEFDLRERIYRHLQTLELGYFDSQQTGQLMSRATVDLQSIRFFLGYGLIFITQSALTLVLAGAIMFVLQPGLAALALLPVPFVVFTASRYNRTSRPALQEVQQRIAELTVEAEESVSGVRVVKAFAREQHMLDRFRDRVVRVFDQNVFSTRLRAFYNPMIAFLPNLGLAVVLLVGGRQVINGTLTLGDFTAFYTYLVMLIGPMRMLGTALGMSQRAIASGNRLFEILDREPRIESPAGAPPLPAGGGRVEMRGVSLAYDELRSASAAPRPDGEEAIHALNGIDLEIEAGRTVALVGPSGSGKTSLVALIARLYDPSEGAVLVDGADVRGVDVGSLRREIAFVADDSFLFTASVAENIAYARPGAGREEVEEAARRAQADGFIRDLPDGYETRVGERGLTLSGGQRQRVAIARALLADPRILILDDATSSVDATTESAIKSGLQEAMAGRTTFVIAHRLSTVSLADEVIVMDGGEIVDRGTHRELLEGCSFYREIAEHGLADSVFLQRDLERREELARL
jgi:ATP-binding cassette subfamily B protein